MQLWLISMDLGDDSNVYDDMLREARHEMIRDELSDIIHQSLRTDRRE